MVEFEWDEDKNILNQQKHKIRFEDAKFVFDDPLAISDKNCIVDGEQRWQIVGRYKPASSVLIVVIHTIRENGTEIIRIISARPLEPKERRLYEHC